MGKFLVAGVRTTWIWVCRGLNRETQLVQRVIWCAEAPGASPGPWQPLGMYRVEYTHQLCPFRGALHPAGCEGCPGVLAAA